jgi:hypothetical protein
MEHQRCLILGRSEVVIGAWEELHHCIAATACCPGNWDAIELHLGSVAF